MEKTADRDVKVYEIGYLIVPSIPEEKVAGEIRAIKDILAKHKVEVIADEMAALRPLAYTMVKKIGTVNRRFDSAYFGWIKFEAAPVEVRLIEKEVKEVESILRLLLINTVREHTLLSSKLNLEAPFDKHVPEGGTKRPVSIEDMDKSIDKTVSDLTVA
jgi:ribosomal protein S6